MALATLSGWVRGRGVIVLGLFFLFGCHKNALFVQQEWIDRDFLASTHIHTPDPRQESPPVGMLLITRWNLPFARSRLLVLTVRFWDNTQQTFSRTIRKKRGYETFFISHKEEGKKILAYAAEIRDEQGKVEAHWTHPFWTQWVDFAG